MCTRAMDGRSRKMITVSGIRTIPGGRRSGFHRARQSLLLHDARAAKRFKVFGETDKEVRYIVLPTYKPRVSRVSAPCA